MKTRNIFNLKFTASTLKEAVNMINHCIRKGDMCFAEEMNLRKIILYRKRNRTMVKSVKNAKFLFADGMPIVWASKIAGRPLPGRVTGCDLAEALILDSKKSGNKVFLLATNDSDQSIARRAVKRIKDKGIDNVKGYTQLYSITKSGETDPVLINAIKKWRPDVVLVGLGGAEQDDWILKWQKKLKIPFCVGVGGSMDIISGQSSRAPSWMQKTGLEWLFQIIKKPKKIIRFYDHVAMFFILIAWAIGKKIKL